MKYSRKSTWNYHLGFILLFYVIQDNLQREVENLNSTDDWESSKEAESAADPSNHVGELHPAVLGDPVEYDAIEVDPEKLKFAPVFSVVCTRE